MDLKDINRSHIATDGAGNRTYGNPTEYFGPAIIAFIDLLGFSAALRSSWGDAETTAPSRLLRIKAAASQIPNQSIVTHLVGSGDNRLYRPRIKTISDSIVICNALPMSGNLGDLIGSLVTVSYAVQRAWGASLAEGFTIRGGLELGEIYWDESETIGPALADSYLLEAKVAKNSRIIAGPKLLENLTTRLSADIWPIDHWLCVSDDELIQLTPHVLRDDSEVHLLQLRDMKAAAGSNGKYYDSIIAELGPLPKRRADTTAITQAAKISGELLTKAASPSGRKSTKRLTISSFLRLLAEFFE